MGNKPSNAEDEPDEQEIEEAMNKLQIEDPGRWRVAQYRLTLEKGAKPFIYESKEDDVATSKSLKFVKSIFTGAASAKILPTRFELMTGRFLSRSTTFGIRDTAFVGRARDSWMIRVDHPHANVDFHHLNINPKITGVPDPHLQLPAGAANIGGVATKTIRAAGIAAIVVAAVVDTARVGVTIYDDIKDNHTLSFKTVKASSSVASGWAGGLGGAFIGNSAGTAAGAAIGGLFGGIGAVPGALIGSIVGSLAGGVGGGVGASIAAEGIVDVARGKLNGRLVTYDSGNIQLKPTFSPVNSDQADEWLTVVVEFLKLVLTNREMRVLTWHKAEHILSTEQLNKITTETMDEMNSFKATMSTSFVSDVCRSPQFFYSELALTPDPKITDALKLRGCVKSNVLKGDPDVACEFICMSNDGSSLCWLNPAMTMESVKKILEKNGSDILVSDSPIFALI